MVYSKTENALAVPFEPVLPPNLPSQQCIRKDTTRLTNPFTSRKRSVPILPELGHYFYNSNS